MGGAKVTPPAYVQAATAAAGLSGRSPVVVGPPPPAVAAGPAERTVGAWLTGMVSRDVTYVNGVTVAIGGNPAGERVLIVVASRVSAEAVDAAAAAAAAAATPSTASPPGAAPAPQQQPQARILRKDKVGGQVQRAAAPATATASKTAAASAAAAAALVADLTGASAVTRADKGVALAFYPRPPRPCAPGGAATGGGIHCVLAQRRAPQLQPYRGSGGGPSARARAVKTATVASVTASSDDDPFGFSAPPAAAPAAEASGDLEDGADETTAAPSFEDEEAFICAVPAVPSASAAALADAQLLPGAAAAQAREAAAGVAGSDTVSRVSAAVAAGVSADVFLAGFDDGAAPPPSPDSPAGDWSALRVSFLDVEWREAAGGADAAHSPWALSRVEEELVAVVCEWAAALRGQRVLAESAWAEAVQVRLSA